MSRPNTLSIAVVLITTLLWLAPPARAQVHDNAHIFGPDAVSYAESAMRRMDAQYHKQFVVETLASVPADQRAALQQQGKEAFFDHLKATRANSLGVNGVYVLICMDPPFIDDAAGRNTVQTGVFTNANLSELRQQFRTALHDKANDQGLRTAVDYVDQIYTTDIPNRGGGSVVGGGHPAEPSRTERAVPNESARSDVNRSDPVPPADASQRKGGTLGRLGCGAFVCLAVALVIVLALVRRLFSNRGPPTGGSGGGFGTGTGGGFGGGGGTNYPTGGPTYGGGGVQQRTGGGFGSGLLGGLLGGAVGGYAADKFEHRNDPTAGGGQSAGTFGGGDVSGGGGGGGGFDSGPSDAGQGFGDSGGGTDFSSGGDAGGGGGGDAGGGGDQGSF